MARFLTSLIRIYITHLLPLPLCLSFSFFLNLYSSPVSFWIPLSTAFILSLCSYINIFVFFSFRQTCIRIMMQGKMSVSFKYPFYIYLYYFIFLLILCTTKGIFLLFCCLSLYLSLSGTLFRSLIIRTNIDIICKEEKIIIFFTFISNSLNWLKKKKTWLNTKRMKT